LVTGSKLPGYTATFTNCLSFLLAVFDLRRVVVLNFSGV
jgi:hypothetical protein